jgi:hypothetical protein
MTGAYVILLAASLPSPRYGGWSALTTTTSIHGEGSNGPRRRTVAARPFSLYAAKARLSPKDP